MRCPECGKITGDINRHIYLAHGIKSPSIISIKREDSEFLGYMKDRKTKIMRRVMSR